MTDMKEWLQLGQPTTYQICMQGELNGVKGLV
jgi:hypothetical protein